jgi:non-heme chloroperoxidase
MVSEGIRRAFWLRGLLSGARRVVYEGVPHGITDTHKERLGADLLAFAHEVTA